MRQKIWTAEVERKENSVIFCKLTSAKGSIKGKFPLSESDVDKFDVGDLFKCRLFEDEAGEVQAECLEKL